MKVHVPSALSNASDSAFLTDAVYFVVRALRNSLRGYHTVEVSTEPSPQARKLAEKAIKEIEAIEQESVIQMDNDRIGDYIFELQAFLEKKTAPKSKSSLKAAEKLLQKMRANHT